MKSVAIISKNNKLFDDLEQYVIPLLYKSLNKISRKTIKQKINDYIWSVIEPYVTFVTVKNEEDFYEVVAQEAQKNFPDHLPSECVYYTGSSYSTPKKFYEVLSWKPSWDDYQDASKDISVINNIGCLLSLNHAVIENSCIMITNEYQNF